MRQLVQKLKLRRRFDGLAFGDANAGDGALRALTFGNQIRGDDCAGSTKAGFAVDRHWIINSSLGVHKVGEFANLFDCRGAAIRHGQAEKSESGRLVDLFVARKVKQGNDRADARGVTTNFHSLCAVVGPP